MRSSHFWRVLLVVATLLVMLPVASASAAAGPATVSAPDWIRDQVAPPDVPTTSFRVETQVTASNPDELVANLIIWVRNPPTPPATTPRNWSCISTFPDEAGVFAPKVLPKGTSIAGPVVVDLATAVQPPDAYDAFSLAYGYADRNAVEWLATLYTPTVAVPDPCAALPAANPSKTLFAQDASKIDYADPTNYAVKFGFYPKGFVAAPPSLLPNRLVCGSFELFGVTRDDPLPTNMGGDGKTFSGVDPDSPSIDVNGSIGPLSVKANAMVASGKQWRDRVIKFSLPSGAAGNWTFTSFSKDLAGNPSPGGFPSIVFVPGLPYFTDNLTLNPGDAQACKTYGDMADNEFSTWVGYLSSIGLLQGYSDEVFNPEGQITRAQLAVIVERANGYLGHEDQLPTGAPSQACTFSDVTPDYWAAPWIWQACKDKLMQGFVPGKPDAPGIFGGEMGLTRAQTALVLDRAGDSNVLALPRGYLEQNIVLREERLGSGMNRNLRDPLFTDVTEAAAYRTAVHNLFGAGIIDGFNENTFGPEEPITRAQLAKIMYRAISLWYPVQAPLSPDM